MNEHEKLDSFATSLEVVASADLYRGAVGSLPFLRLAKHGDWEYGRECTAPDPESVWAWNPLSMQHGWVLWGDGIKEGELMGPIQVKLPAAPDSRWNKQYSVQMLCVAGADKDEAVLYIGTASGLLDVFATMVKDIIRQIRTNEPSVPLVKLRSSHYQHKKYGRIYKPTLEVIRWVSPDATPEELEAAAA